MSARIGAHTLQDPWLASIWLIVAYCTHLIEEWVLDFPAWTQIVRIPGVTDNEFIVINTVFLACVVAAAIYVRRNQSQVWIPITLAMVWIINALVHALATWRYNILSPGLLTGLLIYIPLGVLVLRALGPTLRGHTLMLCFVAAVVIQTAVALIAFL